MICEFKDESQRCFQTKTFCRRYSFVRCKYYARQKPKDENLYRLKFRRALVKALKRRDIMAIEYPQVKNRFRSNLGRDKLNPRIAPEAL